MFGESCIEEQHQTAGLAGVDLPLRGENVSGAGSHDDACKRGNVGGSLFPFAQSSASCEDGKACMRERVGRQLEDRITFGRIGRLRSFVESVAGVVDSVGVKQKVF